MIRHVPAAALAAVISLVACGRFGADESENVATAGDDDGGSPSADAGVANPEAGDPKLEIDAAGRPPCARSTRPIETFEGGKTLAERGWSDVVTTNGATLALGSGTLLATILKKPGEQRAFLQFNHDPTPCASVWKYSLEFKALAGDFPKRIAGPRLEGAHPAVQPGADGFDNHVAVGFAFSKKRVELSLTDDACPSLEPGRCLVRDTVEAGGGKVGPAGNVTTYPELHDADLEGWVFYRMVIETSPTPTGANGYGTIRTLVETTGGNSEHELMLPFPLQEMQIRSHVGVSLVVDSDPDKSLTLDDVKVSLDPL